MPMQLLDRMEGICLNFVRTSILSPIADAVFYLLISVQPLLFNR